MRKRPLSLTFFSFFMVGVFFSLPLQAIYQQDLENLIRSLTLLNIMVALLCLLSAIAAYCAHKSIRYLLPITIVTVIFNNWWVGYVGFNYNLTQTSIASLSFIALCSLLLERNSFQVLSNPKLKWWNIAVRQKTQIPVTLALLHGETLLKKSFDISESGIFLQGLEKAEFERLRVGEKLRLCLHFGKILKIRCSAKIVRKTEALGIYPSGIGFQFEESDEKIRAAIRNLSQASTAIVGL